MKRTIQIVCVALVVSISVSSSSAEVKVAVVRSWYTGMGLPVFSELSSNWSAYGTIPVTVDTSLIMGGSFTYQDLVDTQADVLWLCNSAGGQMQFSSAQMSAVAQYVDEGHSILGTFKLFSYSSTLNLELAPIFGLPADLVYNNDTGASADRSFEILVPGPFFNGIGGLGDSYQSSGYPRAQVPADDSSWDAEDLGLAELQARTPDKRGVITRRQMGLHHAIYVSEMVEYYGSATDTQFIYNALTTPEPATMSLLALGGLAVLKRRRR